MTHLWAAIWPINQTGRPRYRHCFDELEASEFGHTISGARSLCDLTFPPVADWYYNEEARTVTGGECPACRARLDNLTGGENAGSKADPERD